MTEEAFAQAVEEYGDTLFRVAYSCLRNRSDAQDVMQETLRKFYMEKKPFQSPEHEKRWLIRVAVNESKKLLRSAWRRRSVPLEERDEAITFDTLAQRALFEEVMALPPKYRWPVYLHYIEGYTAEEIGTILRCPRNTVLSRLQRARKKLKDALKEEWT